jgi:hypothetical protein
MTHQDAIVNSKKNSLKILYDIVIKEQGGVCTKTDINTLKGNLKKVYNSLFFDCEPTNILCDTLYPSVLSNCSVTSTTCSNILPNPYTITQVSGTDDYNLYLPPLSNYTYVWSCADSTYSLTPTNNTCAVNELIVHTCGFPFQVRCTITNTIYGCSTVKIINLNTHC